MCMYIYMCVFLTFHNNPQPQLQKVKLSYLMFMIKHDLLIMLIQTFSHSDTYNIVHILQNDQCLEEMKFGLKCQDSTSKNQGTH